MLPPFLILLIFQIVLNIAKLAGFIEGRLSIP
jgi:hypothetical protein